MNTIHSVTDVQVDDWLTQQVGTARKTLITDHPWAKTYRVSAAAQQLFLKVLPESQRGGMIATALLGRRFPGIVPQVLAQDVALGFQLLFDHGGRDIGGHADRAQRLGVLRTYAGLQAACAVDKELSAALPEIDLLHLTDDFCRFFQDLERTGQGEIGAAHFLGAERANFYFDRLQPRAAILRQAVLDSLQLPATANHCDLRTQNTAQAADGSFILFDWDEVVAGPAGMSLHNFFSGCSATVELLAGCDESGRTEQRELLDAYIGTLADAGYASREQLQTGLPGAMCAGVMRYLMSYGKFPMTDEQDREQVAKILVRRLDDLLTFCDLRSVPQRATVVRLVDDYEEADAPERARHLLSNYLATTPHDDELQVRLGFVHRYLGDQDAAERHCRRALESSPAQPDLRYLLGRLLLDRLAIDEAVEQFRLAATFAPSDAAIHHGLADAVQLQDLERHAARAGCMPTIRFSQAELSTGLISKAKRRFAGRLFREYGTLIVENVFEESLMDRLAATFEDQYRAYLSGDRPEDALKVGNKRFMITVDVADVFNNPALYAAPLLTPILGRLLGDEFILGSFTAVTSLPGAADMRIHKDHPALFSDEELPGPQPTVGVTTLIPLKGFDLTMGTTRVWKGSHRVSSNEAAEMEWQDPCAPKGSCLLMDYRLSHQGLANRSKCVRPVLSLVYNRPWFRDCVNYELQEPLRISRSEFEQVPEAWRRLFAWTRP